MRLRFLSPYRSQHEHVAIEDAPEYTWRGLMVDSGRRFFQMELLKDLLDTMGQRDRSLTQGLQCPRRPELARSTTAPHRMRASDGRARRAQPRRS